MYPLLFFLVQEITDLAEQGGKAVFPGCHNQSHWRHGLRAGEKVQQTNRR